MFPNYAEINDVQVYIYNFIMFNKVKVNEIIRSTYAKCSGMILIYYLNLSQEGADVAPTNGMYEEYTIMWSSIVASH